MPLNFEAGAALLRPVIALNLWTFAMEGWMYATRIPAVNKYKADMRPEATKDQFNAKIPADVRWKADNYNHLLEQPTQFYAVAIALAVLGEADDFNVSLAWAYVGLRIVHSLVQSTINKILLRFGIFLTSSAVLALMTGRAALKVF